MIRWERGRYAIEMTDEPAYSFGSGDNARLYRRSVRCSEYLNRFALVGALAVSFGLSRPVEACGGCIDLVVILWQPHLLWLLALLVVCCSSGQRGSRSVRG